MEAERSSDDVGGEKLPPPPPPPEAKAAPKIGASFLLDVSRPSRTRSRTSPLEVLPFSRRREEASRRSLSCAPPPLRSMAITLPSGMARAGGSRGSETDAKLLSDSCKCCFCCCCSAVFSLDSVSRSVMDPEAHPQHATDHSRRVGWPPLHARRNPQCKREAMENQTSRVWSSGFFVRARLRRR